MNSLHIFGKHARAPNHRNVDQVQQTNVTHNNVIRIINVDSRLLIFDSEVATSPYQDHVERVASNDTAWPF